MRAKPFIKTSVNVTETRIDEGTQTCTWKNIGPKQKPLFSYFMRFFSSQTYNQFHNILRLLDVLPIFLFTTSETMGHYYLEA